MSACQTVSLRASGSDPRCLPSPAADQSGCQCSHPRASNDDKKNHLCETFTYMSHRLAERLHFWLSRATHPMVRVLHQVRVPEWEFSFINPQQASDQASPSGTTSKLIGRYTEADVTSEGTKSDSHTLLVGAQRFEMPCEVSQSRESDSQTESFLAIWKHVQEYESRIYKSEPFFNYNSEEHLRLSRKLSEHY